MVSIIAMEKNWKQSNQKWRIYCEGKSSFNVSFLINLHQDFRMVIPSVDKITMDV